MKPTVSINLCCYNSEKYLRETLESVVEQTYKDWELVIINDGSSDSTESIISEYIRHGYPIIYHCQENKGLGASRNEALKLSSGEYIAFLDHDDIWLPGKLEKQIPLFNNPKIGLVFSDVFSFNMKGDVRRLYQNIMPARGRVFKELLRNYFLFIPTVIVRKKALHSLSEWFDERLTINEEADLFIRLAYNWEVDFINEPLAKWRVHSESLTWSKKELFPQETEIMLNKYLSSIPNFQSEFKEEAKLLRMKILKQRALLEWENGRVLLLREMLQPYIKEDAKFLLLYLFSYMPFKFFNALFHKYKKIKGLVTP